MTYGFSCGYCRESVDTPFVDPARAELFADMMGWRVTCGHMDAFGGTAHNTCPRCAEGALHRVHLSGNPQRPITGLLADAVSIDTSNPIGAPTMAARTWFTKETCPDLTDADRRVLNTAARNWFQVGKEPSRLELMTLRTTYKPGMSANDLLDAAT